MKKIFMILTMLLSTALYAETLNLSKSDNFELRVLHDGAYTLPCYKCYQATHGYMSGYSYCLGCPAWRDYSFNIKHWEHKYNPELKDYVRVPLEGNKEWFLYRCQHGHSLYVAINGDEQR